jgi:mono/diheme cytochrome c family protein
MIPLTLRLLTLLLAGGIVLGGSTRPKKPVPVAENEAERIARGKVYFEWSCSPCHGIGGKGNGPIAANLRNLPRDLTLGVYKNRSTASGQLPTDYDIYRSITAGVHTSSMPPFSQIDPKVRWMLVAYVKTLSTRFSDSEEYPLDTVKLSKPLPVTPAGLAQGRKIYVAMKCYDCHGNFGRGDGAAAPTQHDDAGHYVASTDLTNRSAYKFASNVSDVYRIFSTGLNGVPMPSYTNSLSDDERWHLANYVWALQNHEQYPAIGGIH